jgi:ferredoxin
LSRKTARAANRKGRALAAYFAGEVNTLAKTPVVDADTCTGCGLCEQVAPETFRLNDDGIAEVVDPAGNDEETIQEAIDSCPVEAISWAA